MVDDNSNQAMSYWFRCPFTSCLFGPELDKDLVEYWDIRVYPKMGDLTYRLLQYAEYCHSVPLTRFDYFRIIAHATVGSKNEET